MYRAFLLITFILNIAVCNELHADEIYFLYGKVVDERNSTPISGVRVTLGAFRKTWKFWDMPEYEVLESFVTDEDGNFYFSKRDEKYYILTLSEGVCWKPFSKSFSKDDIELMNEVIIKTSSSTKDYCK